MYSFKRSSRRAWELWIGSTIFQLFHKASAPINAFLEFLLPEILTIFFSKPLASPHNHQNNDQQGEWNDSGGTDYPQSLGRIQPSTGSNLQSTILTSFKPSPHIQSLGSSNSAATKDMMSKICT